MVLQEHHEIQLKTYIQGTLAEVPNVLFECGEVDVQPDFQTKHRICHFCAKHLGDRAIKLKVTVEYIFEGTNEVKKMGYTLHFCSTEKMMSFLNLLPQFFAFGYEWTHCSKSSDPARGLPC